MVDLPERNKKIEVAMISSVAVLVSIGLLAIYASSAMKGIHLLDDPYLFLRKQSFSAILGFSAFFFAQRIPSNWIKNLPLPVFLISLFLLMLILIPGTYVKVGGATRWLNLFGYTFQPSELAKVGLILFIAKNLARKSFNIKSFWYGIIPNFFFMVLFAFFLMLQPDFGTTALLGCITFSMLIVAGMSRRYIVYFCIFASLSTLLAILAAPYRVKRILAFLNPWDQIKDGGFQIIQSYLAFQNGGFLGTGFGESKQKLFFLPEAHTDFIMSVIGEEIGFLGISLVVMSYLLLTYCTFQITKDQHDKFFRFLCFGFSLLISGQAIFNMGVVTGLLPTKGITLPFISNGSSSLLVFLGIICIFIVANRKQHSNKNNHDN